MTWRARGARRSLTVTAPGPCGPVLRRDTARLPSRAAHGRGPRCRSGGTSCHRLPRPRLLCRAAWRRGLARAWAAVCRLPAGAAARRHPRRHHRRPADPDGQFADLPGHVGPAPGLPGSSTPSTSSWCTPPSATASLIPTLLPSPSACQAAAESTPTCSSLSSPEDRDNQPPPGTRPRVPAAPRRRYLCVDERAPSRSSSEPGSALRSPVTTGPGVAELTELLCYQPASRPDTSMPH